MNEKNENITDDSTDNYQKQVEDEDKEDNNNNSLDNVESESEFNDLFDNDEEKRGNLEDETLVEEDLPEMIAEEKAEKIIDKEDTEKDLRTIQKNLIEGALYAAGSPLDIEEIATKLEISKKFVEELITELAYEYLERSSALVIAQVGERYQMQLRPEYTESVSKFTKGGAIAEKYLRTLTIIALKQPILKSTVVKLRGTGAYEHVKYLLDNELITAEKKGRSSELMTTDKYADMFGLPKNREELKRTMISQLGLDNKKE
ncbi:MAG: SMC-Scp complex subunit ScpB [Promethearchaeota archaeon]|nr:MAG: SMC-Scp complex subunit ScpB [Candidatus Lokiarchaeota archaeon]